MTSPIEDCFPFTSFRNHQKRILREVVESFEKGNEVAIIEGPTGFGKSPVNIALALYYKPAFYTTPQVKLVNQLTHDFGPDKLAIDGGEGPIIPLLGRKNYICRESNKPSDLCPIYEGGQTTEDEFGIPITRRCPEVPNCTYWRHQHELILFAEMPNAKPIKTGDGDVIETVIKTRAVPVDERDHPAQKPVELIRKLILKSSKKGDLVADFFAGTGVVLKEAKRLGRRYFGCEYEKTYYALGKKELDSIDLDIHLSEYSKSYTLSLDTFMETE